jgi:hypothetical protein
LLQRQVLQVAPTRRCIESQYFVSKLAGHSWTRDGSAAAVFGLQPTAKAPRVMYIEARLPRPSPNAVPQIVRKKIWRWLGFAAVFKGEQTHGWRAGYPYTYVAKLYADAGYQTLLGTHTCRAPCASPR